MGGHALPVIESDLNVIPFLSLKRSTGILAYTYALKPVKIEQR